MVMTPFTRSTGTVLTWAAHALLASTVAAEHPRAFIVGPAGSGKTTLVNRISEELRRRGTPVRFVDPDAHLAALTDPSVLLVDDLNSLAPRVLDAVRDRAANPEAGLIVAARPWPTSTIGVDIARRLEQAAPPILLGRVARSDVLSHLDEAAVEVHDECIDHILKITDGITWLVSLALSAHDIRDCQRDPGHSDLEVALRSQVIHRLDTLPDAIRVPLTRLCAGTAGPWRDGEGTESDVAMHGYAHGLLRRSGTPASVVRSAALSATAARSEAARTQAVTPEHAQVQRALAAWSMGDVTGASAMIDTLPATSAADDFAVVSDLSAGIWAARAMMSTASDVYAAHPAKPGSAAGVLATIAHVGAGAADRLAEAPSTGTVDPRAHGTTRIALGLLDRGLRETLQHEPASTAPSDLLRGSDLYSAGGSTLPLPEAPAVIAAAASLGSGEPASAIQLIDDAITEGQCGAWGRRRLLLWQAWILMEAERPQEARAAIEAADALDTPVQRRDTLLREALRIGLTRRYDTRAALEATWRGSRERIRHTDVDLYTIIPFTTALCASAAVGDGVTLSPHLDRALEIVRQLGNPPTWGTHLWWAGVQRGILLNRPDLVAPHARSLVAAAEANRLAAVMSSAGAVWMSVLAGHGDSDAVETAARSLAGAGCAWDGARLAAHASRRAKDKRASLHLLSIARELHPRDPVSAAATAPGGTATPADPAVGVLSEREFDVAVLVLEGRTYNEIGQAVFISPKTVEHHVARIKRRIGATSRSDLMAKLRVLVDARTSAQASPPPETAGTNAQVPNRPPTSGDRSPMQGPASPTYRDTKPAAQERLS